MGARTLNLEDSVFFTPVLSFSAQELHHQATQDVSDPKDILFLPHSQAINRIQYI